jgi:ABC-type nitrate/sulfonate/bicarbonate transport system permease component
MRANHRLNWSGWLLFALLLMLWEVGARGAPTMQLYFPPVSQITAAFWHALTAGTILPHLAVTFTRFAEGFLIATVLAVGAGVVLGYSRLLHSFVVTLIEFLRPMPSVAIIPVAILLLGISDSMIVSVTVYACVWPILINTIDGVRNIDNTLIDTGRTFGLTRWRMLSQIILPGASPYIMTGLRIGLSIALILVTTAEMVASSSGLGYYILDEERAMNSANMYGGIVLVAALGYTLNRLFLVLEARAMRWRHGMMARQAA